MARPKLAPATVVNIKLYLREGEGNDDIIAFFARVPARLRAKSVMQALRSGGLTTAIENLPSDADIEAALDAFMS